MAEVIPIKPMDLEAVAAPSAAVAILDSSMATLAARGLDDIGNARRFVEQHREVVVWIPQSGWYVWDGKRWAEDKMARVLALAKDVARGIYNEAAAETGDKVRESLVGHAHTSARRERLNAMLELAKPDLARDINDFDRDPFALNCLNGTIDLKTGKLRKHDARDLITKITPVAFDSQAKARQWERALLTIFKEDKALIDYVQRLFGYSLSAQQMEHILILLFGRSHTGKSTLVGTFYKVAGEYAQTASADLLLAKKFENAIPNDVARLKGARFVAAAETEDGKRLNSAKVKNLTGGDMLTARFMRREFFDFEPTHTFWLSTNYKPDIDAGDSGAWSRLKLVPFGVVFEGDDDDKRLKDKLLTESEGILAWAVRGAVAWWNRGKPDLREPKVVTDAIKAYQKEMDWLADFIAAECEVGDSFEVGATAIYERYKAWITQVGKRAQSQTRFGGRLGDKFEKDNRESGVWYFGVKLKPKPTDIAEASTIADLEQMAKKRRRKFARNVPPNDGTEKPAKKRKRGRGSKGPRLNLLIGGRLKGVLKK